MNRLITVVFLAGAMIFADAQAGLFIFAETSENPDLIAHPTGYTGGNNEHLTISVCIHPDSANQAALEIPLRNTITVWNRLDPVLGNTTLNDPQLAPNEVDLESVLLHEVGHCLGLAHPNLATESGLSGNDRRYAKALQGTNNQYDLNAGVDGVIGTRDDVRIDDTNLNWFRMVDNDPFAFSGPFDISAYSTDLNDLPTGHLYVEIAGLQVAQHRGHPNDEAVMHQGTSSQETQRELNRDDAAMIRLGMSGSDRSEGTAKDYTYELVYGGVDNDCDITVSLEGNNFGICKAFFFVDFPEPDHIVITPQGPEPEDRTRIELDPTINWFFNNELLDDDEVFHDRFEQ